MSKLFNVRVRPDYRYSIAQVSGRIFSKKAQAFAEAYLDDEIRDSEILEVSPIETEALPATGAAKPRVKASRSKSRLLSGVGEDL